MEGLDLENNRIGPGVDSYVYEVAFNGKKCIAKRLQGILISAAKHYPHGQGEAIVEKFLNECHILSQLKHHNVVSFVGVHYGP